MLAGGGSRRMGGAPKGLEEVGGRRILDRVLDALREVTPQQVVVTNDPVGASWVPTTPVVPDRHPGRGGLAGIEAALDHARGRGVVVVAWDMPFVTGDLLGAIIDAARTADADVALPQSESPYGFEPFCAFYSARVRAPLTEFLDAGGGPARDFLRTVARRELLADPVVRRIGDARRLFFNVNTEADLRRARAMAKPAE